MRFLIDFLNLATEQEINNYLASNNLTVVSIFSNFDKVYLVEGNTEPSADNLVESVIRDDDNPLTLLSLDNPQVSFVTNNDNNWWKLSSFQRLNLEAETQTVPRRGSSSIVYLVDSGVNRSHLEFENSSVVDLYSFNGDFTDYNGHGTALASVICGETCAVSTPTVKSVKIFQSGTPTLLSHLLAAFDSIITDTNNTPDKLHIVNLSWSIDKNSYVENKIRTLIQSGTLVVASAGNNAQPIENVTPASMPEVITVGAYDKDFKPCDFSNYTGSLSTAQGTVNYGGLDTWAPGQDIYVADVNGGYKLESGTSLSAAICSSVLAYNSFIYEIANNQIPIYVNDAQQDLRYYISLKQDTLTLEGQYAENPNVVVAFLQSEKDDPTIKYAKPLNIQQIFVSGRQVCTNIGLAASYQSLSIRDPLPEGLNFDGKHVYGVLEAAEPFDWNSELTYTRFDGTTHTTSYKIVGIPDTMTANQVLADEELKVKLQVFGCGYYYYQDQFEDCGGSCSPGLCFDLGAACGEKYTLCVCTYTYCP